MTLLTLSVFSSVDVPEFVRSTLYSTPDGELSVLPMKHFLGKYVFVTQI